MNGMKKKRKVYRSRIEKYCLLAAVRLLFDDGTVHICIVRSPSDQIFILLATPFFPGMWITADFRLYPPVITANQELVSPTGDHRYRGGTERAHPRGFRV